MDTFYYQLNSKIHIQLARLFKKVSIIRMVRERSLLLGICQIFLQNICIGMARNKGFLFEILQIACNIDTDPPSDLGFIC